jgi:hypothetical protein
LCEISHFSPHFGNRSALKKQKTKYLICQTKWYLNAGCGLWVVSLRSLILSNVFLIDMETRWVYRGKQGLAQGYGVS